jgi:hypothetical protein
MCGHGFTVVGSSIEECAFRAVYTAETRDERKMTEEGGGVVYDCGNAGADSFHFQSMIALRRSQSDPRKRNRRHRN